MFVRPGVTSTGRIPPGPTWPIACRNSASVRFWSLWGESARCSTRTSRSRASDASFWRCFGIHERVGRAFQACRDQLKLEGATDQPTMPDPLLFFTEPQVVAVAKIALLVCPHVTERSSGSFQPVGEALMMAADLIGREENVGLTPDIRSAGSRDAWLRFVVMNGLFNASDNFRSALARTHDLYLRDGPGPGTNDGSIDLRKRFREITGLDPDFAWAMGFSLFANWRTVDPKSDRPPGPLSLEAYMSALNITGAECAAIRKLFAVDAGEARDTLRKRGCGPDSLRPYDVQPLDRSPLVSLEGRLYCPSVQLLRWKLTTGLHHVFLQPSERNDSARPQIGIFESRRPVFSRTMSRHCSDASFPRKPGAM